MELEKLSDVLLSPNLSIDILSLDNTNYGSDGSCDGFEQLDTKENNSEVKEEVDSFMTCLSQVKPSNYKCRLSSAKTPNDSCSNFENGELPGSMYCKNDQRASKKWNIYNSCCCAPYNNSFYVYMSTLSREKDLHKYFRLCHTCKKAFCVCLDSFAHCNIARFSSKMLQQQEDKHIDSLCGRSDGTSNLMKKNKAVETDVKVTEFDIWKCECLRFRSSKIFSGKGTPEWSDLNSYKDSFCRNNFKSSKTNEANFSSCCGIKRVNVCCKHSDQGYLDSGIDGTSRMNSSRVSLESLREPCLESSWTPYLESATHNARNLVRDLEMILNTYKGESV